MGKGENSMMSKVMAAFARPTRLVNSQKADPNMAVDEGLFEEEEERQLQIAYQQVASQVSISHLINKHLTNRTSWI